MVSSIVKWFIKGDQLTKEVKNAIQKDNISNSSKQHTDDKVNEIIKLKEMFSDTPTWYNRSKWYVNAKKRAIKSTLKEIVREQKTVAIAKLLRSCNISTEIKTLRNDQASKTQLAEIVKEAKKIAENHDYDKVLSDDEITVIMKNESTIGNLFKKYQVISPLGVCTNINVNKALIKEVESKLPYMIPKDKQTEYQKYYTVGLDHDVASKTIKEMRDILVKDVKRNFLAKLTETEKTIIVSAARENKMSLSSFRNIGKLSHSSETGAEANSALIKLDKLIREEISDKKVIAFKARALQNAAKENKQILANFTDIDIQLLNLLFSSNREIITQ